MASAKSHNGNRKIVTATYRRKGGVAQGQTLGISDKPFAARNVTTTPGGSFIQRRRQQVARFATVL